MVLLTALLSRTGTYGDALSGNMVYQQLQSRHNPARGTNPKQTRSKPETNPAINLKQTRNKPGTNHNPLIIATRYFTQKNVMHSYQPVSYSFTINYNAAITYRLLSVIVPVMAELCES